MRYLGFCTLWRQCKRSRTRAAMRGYLELKRTGRLDRIALLNHALTTTPLKGSASYGTALVFGAGLPHAETIVRQFLLARVAGHEMNEALLISCGKEGQPVRHAMPAQWREIVRHHGFAVSGFGSAAAWWMVLCRQLVFGVLRCVRRVWESIRVTILSGPVGAEQYVYFDGLAPGNLPQLHGDGRSHDIVTWYMRWNGRARGIDALYHSIRNVPERSVANVALKWTAGPEPPLNGLARLFVLICWSVLATVRASLDLIRGRWWHGFMLGEATLAAVARTQISSCLAREYLFHNSNWMYRPLWTYEAQKHGSQITLYFYSTNCEPVIASGQVPMPIYGYCAMSWPRYLVWDDDQANFVRRCIGVTAQAVVVGPIWFQTSALDLPPVAGKTLAVFDVAPVRASFYVKLGLEAEYYVPRVASKFLEDIHEVALQCGHVVAWKRKRKIRTNASPRYIRFAEGYSRMPQVNVVDPDISAHRLIESSDLVVSMPFTSTALIARELGKPSCYYDPTGRLAHDDAAAHGIPIIQGTRALASWVLEHTPSLQHNSGY